MEAENPSIESLFEQALALSAGPEREAFLIAACHGDSLKRRELEALLEAVTEANGFFEGGPPGKSSLSVGEQDQKETLFSSPNVREKPGTVIGNYKLLEQIGEGGFGTVYMAEQTQPVNRKVALKIVKMGMDTKQVIARFESERQALALMDHVNIARVFDGGATESGRPYFVMELVKGVPITEFCNAHRLSTEGRLRLFIDVCEAMQHAHQKGVIHRDIKPSNVLVSMHGDRVVPKVIDFGIAKATQQPLTDKTLFTQFQQILGTPAYMSPEQTGMSGLDVDTRTDVYSLGVLLYEMLVGATPFETEGLVKKGYLEILRVIRESDIPRPSTRLGSLTADQRATAATSQGVDPRRLELVLRGDLDWILVKALEKERQRRYESPAAFARDISGYLAQEPVSAVSPSAGYRMRKFVERHRVAVMMAAVVALTLILAAVVSLRQAYIATGATAAARRSESKWKSQLELTQEAERVATQARLDAESTVAELWLERGREAYVRNLVSPALAYMSKAVRANPLDRVASGQLQVALMQGRYGQRLYEPLRHDGQLEEIIFSDDGRLLITGADGGKVRIWNAQTGQLMREPLVHESGFWHVELSSDQKILMTHTDYRYSFVKIWDVATGELLKDRVGEQEGKTVRMAKLSPDGKRVAMSYGYGDSDNYSKIVEWQSNQQVGATMEQKGTIWECAFSPDGKYLATVGTDVLNIWDANTGQLIHGNLKHPSSGSRTVAFSPDGKRVLFSGALSSLWDVRTGELVNSTTTRDQRIGRAKFSPDGLHFCSTDREHHVYVWDRNLNRTVGPPLFHESAPIYTLFGPNGAVIAIVCSDNRIYLWDWRNRELILEPLINQGFAEKMAFSPDGTMIAAGGWGSQVQVWSTVPPTFSGMRIRSANRKLSRGVAFSPDGKWMLASASTEGWFFDVVTGAAVSRAIPHKPFLVSPKSFSSAGNRVVLVQPKGLMNQVFSVPGGELIGESLVHDSETVIPQMTPDGQRVVTASENFAYVWDARTGKGLGKVGPLGGEIYNIDISPDGKAFLVSTKEEGISVWSLDSLTQVGSLFSDNDIDGFAQFSPGGNEIVVLDGRPPATLIAWDRSLGKRIWRTIVNDQGVRGVRFSKDGLWLITRAIDGRCRIVNAADGSFPYPVLPHAYLNDSAVFSSHSEIGVTSSYDGFVRLWDVGTGKVISKMIEQSQLLRAEVSFNGRWLAASGANEIELVEMPSLEVPLPTSLLDLTEAVAGVEVSSDGELEPLPVSEINRRRSRSMRREEGGFYSRMERWAAGDPSSRTLSPTSSIRLSDEIERRSRSRRLSELEVCLNHSPTNGVVLARMVKLMLKAENDPAEYSRIRATFLMGLANRFSPGNSEVMLTEARLRRVEGKPEVARELVRRVLLLEPENREAISLRDELNDD